VDLISTPGDGLRPISDGALTRRIGKRRCVASGWRSSIPASWQVMVLEVGHVQTIAGRKLLEDLTLVTYLRGNLVDDVHVLGGPGQQPPEDQRCGAAHSNCGGVSNPAA
jgi:hypothetical protein